MQIFLQLRLKRVKIQPYIRGSYTNKSIKMSPINSMNGYASFFKFKNMNITHIQDIYAEYEKVNKNAELFNAFLKDKVGIYSQFYLNKIGEQLAILDDLMN